MVAFVLLETKQSAVAILNYELPSAFVTFIVRVLSFYSTVASTFVFYAL